MTRFARSLVLIPGILYSLSAYGQQSSACGAHPEDPDATITACSPLIKQIQHHIAKCHDEMVWQSSLRESGPLAATPTVPVTMSPECSGYMPSTPLYPHNVHPFGTEAAHNTPRYAPSYASAPGYEPPPDPALGQYLLLRADAYLAKGKFDLAIDDYTSSLMLNAYNPSAWAGRCRSHAIRGSLKQALTDCDTSILLLVNNPTAYEARGLVQLKRRQYALAISDYSTAIQLSQPTPISLYGRGLARRGDSDPTGAAADISAALKLNPDVAAIFKRYRVRLK